MVKLIYLFRRKAGMSEDAFETYWREVHGPLGMRIPGLRRLVQSRAIQIPGDRRPPDFDGVAELWFDDVDTLLRARQSEEWKRSGLDEKNFIDPTSTAYLVTVEHTVLDALEKQKEN